MTTVFSRPSTLALAALVVAGPALAAELPDFTTLAERNGPAVVNIQASGNVESAAPDGDEQDVPEIFKRFFGPGGPNGGNPHSRQGPRVSMGSGFIVSTDGYILTNNHVVDGAETVTVKLSDRRELDAKVIGTDPSYDIALLKVTASNLPAVTFGDSNKLKPGQWVVAIGSPFGFDHSVTHGVVSAVGRGFGAQDQQYIPFIQTDVPINRGNSGGPLFNLDGQVVGVNSQIFSNTGGYMGVSFAIPIDIAMSAMEQIKTSGHVARGMIGVTIQNVDREIAKGLGLPRTGGALVNKITPGSGADKAGVHVGDVILAYNGHDIVGSSDLPPLVGLTKPGAQAELEVFRDGKTVKLPVTVASVPQEKGELASFTPAESPASNKLGIATEELTAEQRKQLGLKDEGVLVSRVSGQAAKRSALAAGDVILMVGRKPVRSPADFNASVKDVKPGDSVMLLVRRDDATTFIALTVPSDKKQG